MKHREGEHLTNVQEADIEASELNFFSKPGSESADMPFHVLVTVPLDEANTGRQSSLHRTLWGEIILTWSLSASGYIRRKKKT